MAAVLYPAVDRLLDRNFSGFENSYIENDSDRIRQAFSANAERLRVFAQDYGRWDSALAFIANPNPAFIEENLYPEGLTNIGVHFAFIVGPSRQVIWSGGLTAQSTDELEPLSADLLEVLMQGADLGFDYTQFGLDALTEFIWVDGECYLLGISAVTDSAGTMFGGWMVFGLRLDLEYRTALSSQVQTNSAFSLAPIDSHPKAVPTQDETIQISIQPDGFSASQSLYSSHRHSAVAILTSGPRPLAVQQAQAQQLLLAEIVLTMLTSILLTYVILHFLVIKRVKFLSGWARGLLGRIVELHQEVPLPTENRDEIDQLQDDFTALTQELQRLSDRWQAEASEDWLTKVGNRAKLMHDLREAQILGHGSAQDTTLQALLLIDMDYFKAVNDLLGHHYGDELLCEVARRLEALAPPYANVYRLGGDEFALFWQHGATRPAVNVLAQKLLDSLCMNWSSFSVSASIGVVVPDSTDESSQSLLMRTDIALYAAKKAGRNQYRYFDNRDLERFKNSFDLDALLRDALKNGKIELYYHPIINSRTQRVHAVEALARWNHSERGAIAPALFVAAAERSGLIHELDAYVLRNSCAALARLRSQFPSLVMNINVSPISLQGDGFLRQLEEILESDSFDVSSLRLELTETAVSDGLPALDHAAATLRALGAALIIDDFGAGSSSFGRLNTLQPEGLKLDGSFVRDFAGSGGRICRAVVELARELDMSVTAEFVETAAQREFLQQIGCDFLQGYHFSQPLTEAALVKWVATFDQEHVSIEELEWSARQY
ncbi:MAG: putative bifunctional diguanylate cyclase/phosphodiesterase [Cyanophyceae cyanobacterium]